MNLTVNGLSFSYDSRAVLDDVTLDIGKGELLGLVGPNGAGKSTLLECINRVLTPDTGTVYVGETDLDELSREGIARLVGYVPQEDDDAFPSTVFDTVLMGRMPHGSWKPSPEDLEFVDDVIASLDMEDLSMRNLDELSGGQRQKVLVGRALAQEAEVLLLDEPTSSLDMCHQLEVMGLITRQVREHDIAAVVAIHDLNLASRYCDKIAMLHDRQIFAAGEPTEVLSLEHIRTVYDVHARILEEDGERVIVPKHALDGTGTDAETEASSATRTNPPHEASRTTETD